MRKNIDNNGANKSTFPVGFQSEAKEEGGG
jgi:hypothetical protein